MSYEFKYRLSTKSSLAAIAKAVRALGLEMKIEKNYISFYKINGNTYENPFMLDERVPEWLNERLEAEGLMEPNKI